MKRALLLAAALGTITFPAHAEIDIGSYKKYLSLGKDGADDAIDMYVIGLGRGAMMANAAVVAKGGEPVFCIPPNLALQGDQIKNILNREIEEETKKGTYRNDFPIEIVMVLAMKRTFPCEQRD